MNDKVTDIILDELKEIKSDVKFLMAKENRRDGMTYVIAGIISLIIAIGGKFL